MYEERQKSLRALGYETYDSYLTSKMWYTIRYRVLYRDYYKCRVCEKHASQVHHGSYDLDSMTGRNLSQLFSVCADCHTNLEFDGSKKRVASEVKKITPPTCARTVEYIPSTRAPKKKKCWYPKQKKKKWLRLEASDARIEADYQVRMKKREEIKKAKADEATRAKVEMGRQSTGTDGSRFGLSTEQEEKTQEAKTKTQALLSSTNSRCLDIHEAAKNQKAESLLSRIHKIRGLEEKERTSVSYIGSPLRRVWRDKPLRSSSQNLQTVGLRKD